MIKINYVMEDYFVKAFMKLLDLQIIYLIFIEKFNIFNSFKAHKIQLLARKRYYY